MKYSLLTLIPLIALAALGVGCSTTPKSEFDRHELRTTADSTLAAFKRRDESLKSLLDKSAAYAVFPDIGKGAFWIGGAYGKGVLYEKDNVVGYCDLTQGTVGFQIGAEAYSEILVLLTGTDVAKFKAGDYQFGANAVAVAATKGAAATADVKKGYVVYIMSKGGLLAEASVGGQRFRYEPVP